MCYTVAITTKLTSTATEVHASQADIASWDYNRSGRGFGGMGALKPTKQSFKIITKGKYFHTAGGKHVELVNPQKLNKPRNVNRFKEGLEKLWTLNLLLLVKRRLEVWMHSQLLKLQRQLPQFL